MRKILLAAAALAAATPLAAAPQDVQARRPAGGSAGADTRPSQKVAPKQTGTRPPDADNKAGKLAPGAVRKDEDPVGTKGGKSAGKLAPSGASSQGDGGKPSVSGPGPMKRAPGTERTSGDPHVDQRSPYRAPAEPSGDSNSPYRRPAGGSEASPYRAPGGQGDGAGVKMAPSEEKAGKVAPADARAGKVAPAGAKAGKVAPADARAGKFAPADARADKHVPADAKPPKSAPRVK